MALFAELRRRNVLKVALLYAVAGWLILWFVSNAGAALGLPAWADIFALLVLAIGFPVALIFAWMYEITPSGIRKAAAVDQAQSIVYKTGQKLNAAVAVLAVLGVLALFGERLMPEFEFQPKFEFLIPKPPVGEPPVSLEVPVEIRSLRLDNGLRVIVWPDHDIPNVAMYNFVRAGSRNERPGITGLSHFFEHMMFNGTKELLPGDFDRMMEDAGGSNNAGTSKDITVYLNSFPRSALEVIFQLEADRLQNLAIYPDAIESERGVVTSERAAVVDDDNFERLMEQVYATAFVAHPYQWPVIGWPSDIAAWTERDLVDYFRSYYAPNNCTIVLTGDVTPTEVFRLADRYLGRIPAQAAPPAVRTVEPVQRGSRRVSVEVDAQAPLLHLAFHAPSAADPGALPLKLLMEILVGDDSSRLHRLLVEEQRSAVSIGGWLHEGFDPGLVYFYATLPPGGDPAAVEDALLEALVAVAAEGVSDAELAKTRNIALADFWRSLATIDGKADALGTFDVFHGSYEKLFELPQRLDAVTAEDLRAAAERTFRSDNVTVGVLSPVSATRISP